MQLIHKAGLATSAINQPFASKQISIPLPQQENNNFVAHFYHKQSISKPCDRFPSFGPTMRT